MEIPKKHFKGKEILITGGLGFIGSTLAHKLVKLGAKVTIIDSLFPEYGGNLFNVREIENAVKIIISDVRDFFSMGHLVKGKDFLFNLAGQTSHMDSMRDPFTDLDINCRAQLSILEACRKYNPKIRIVFASTRQIYGKPAYFPVDEKHPLSPADFNGVSKMSGEWYHILYNNVYGIKTTVLRLTNTYGPRMRIKDARQTFMGYWIRLLVEKKQFEVWEGNQLRDLAYVDDAVTAMLLVCAHDKAVGEIFNLGGSIIISLKDLAGLLVKVYGSGSFVYKHFPANRKKIDIGDYYADFSKIKDMLGWSPQVDLREGLTKTLAFYRKNASHYI